MSALQVLLVEDDEDHVFLIRRAMRGVDELTVGVQVASNGEDAVQALQASRAGQANRPDLVVLDLRLPKLSGHEVLRAIKADPAIAGTPIVVLTSSEDPEEHARARALGADDTLCKPLDGASFRSQVQSMVRRWAGGGA